MTFRELLAMLERKFGNHQFPLNRAARDLRDMFETIPLHPDLVSRLARDVFARNGCRSLDDAVSRSETLGVVAGLRAEVLHARTTDIDTRRLVDEICAAVEGVFSRPAAAATAPKASAEIIDMRNFRRRQGRDLRRK
jgi:hypothetical protein